MCKLRKDGNIRIGLLYVFIYEEFIVMVVEVLFVEFIVVGSNMVVNFEVLGFLFLVSILMMSGIVWN